MERPSEITNGSSYLWLLMIITVGAVLRIYHIDYQSLWYDELHSIIPTHPDNSIASIIEYSKSDQPPFFFIYLHFFLKLFGYNELVGRMAAAVVGIAGIPAMFYLGRELRGNAVGLFAAFLTSLNYMHLYYSQELRFYSMVFLLTTLSFLFLIKAYRSGRILYYGLYAFFTTALLYTQYFGLVIFAAQVVIFGVLICFSQDRSFIWKGLISGLIVCLLFLPWVGVILTHLGIEEFWIRMPGPAFLAEYFYYYFGKDALAVSICAFLFYLFVRPHLSRVKSDRESRIVDYVVLMWLILSYLIPYLKSLAGPPILYVRYTIISLPAWIVMLSIGWNYIRQPKWRYGLVVVLFLSMVINLFFIRKHYSKVDKQQLREISALVREKNVDAYPVFSPIAWQLSFYFRSDSTIVRDLNGADLTNVNDFWLLHADFFSSSEKDEVLAPLSDKFQVVEQHNFHKAHAILLRRFSSEE